MYTILSDNNQALYHTAEEPTSGNYVHGKRTVGMYWDGSRMVSQLPANINSQARKQIKERRDKAIVTGTLVNGMVVATDDLSQQRITGAALAATVDPSVTVRWKLPDDTFVTLGAAQIIDLAQAVRTHIQSCFDREAELLAALNAGESYDLDAGWPSTNLTNE